MAAKKESESRGLNGWMKRMVGDPFRRAAIIEWHNIAGKFYGRNPRKRAEQLFEKEYNRKLDLENPVAFAEKVRWIQFNTDISYWTRLADKLSAREYVAEKGYGSILIPLLGVWGDASGIDFDSLPQSFVIKPNNGCGDLFVVSNKDEVSLTRIRRSLAKSLRSVYGGYRAETHYRDITPGIFAEEMLHQSDAAGGIADYKFFCCNGEPVMCMVCTDRNYAGAETKRVTMYDMDWVRHDEWLRPSVAAESLDVPRPASFERMKIVCRDLTKGMPFVRLDLYDDCGEVRFGEFTFTPAALRRHVSMSDEALQYVADRIDLDVVVESAPELSMAIPTWKADGIKRVVDMQLPEVEGVEYVVSWQQSDGVDLPLELMRNDIKVVRTSTIGVSNNRNNAMAHASGKVVLIADDDCRYTPEQLGIVISTFRDNPATDIASFRYDKPLRKKYPEGITPFERLPKGFVPVTFEIAFRRKLIVGADALRFNPLLGLGAPYLRAGEEDYFIRQAMQRGYCGYFYPYVIAKHSGETTTSRVITDPGVLRAKGAFIALYKPLLWPLAIMTNAYRLRKIGLASFWLSVKEMAKGAFYGMRHLH